MPLIGQQLTYLADAIDKNADWPTLQLWAADLDVPLSNLALMGDVRERALKLISVLNSEIPPRDQELLELLQKKGNASLKAVASALLRPTFYSPTGDAHDAIMLGKRAFVARDDLRRRIREFTNPSPYTTRVLIVSGPEPGGKSYSWEFLRHLAFSSVGATPIRLRLQGTSYTPRQLVERAFRHLSLDLSGLPPLSDNPQFAHIEPLIDEFRGKIISLPKPYWLVIDDLNDPSVTPPVRETAYAMAYSVEELKPANLWIALLGYNKPIVDTELRDIAEDDAEFPHSADIAKHFDLLARSGPAPLPAGRALEIANVLFEKFPKLDKEAMSRLTVLIEKIGEKLRIGLQP